MPDFAAIQPYLPAVLAAVGVVGFVVLVAVLVGLAARRRGVRTLAPAADRAQQRRDRALFVAAFTAATIVYGALILGSFEGLTAWARATLGWTGWEQFIVPVSVDGLGTAAGVLAFRAVRRRTSPYTCYVMVWGATATSMTVNAVEGGKHGSAAAFYMAFLSLAVMAMFHLFLGQFQAGAEYVGKKYPRFGLRWVTYWQTGLDFLCWVNHPPKAGSNPTVVNAVAHRQAWRADAAERRRQRASDRHQERLLAAARKAELAAATQAPDPATESATPAADVPAAAAPAKRQPKAAAKTSPTAAKVARLRARHPEDTQAQIAVRAKCSVRTVREYWTKGNVTPIRETAAQ